MANSVSSSSGIAGRLRASCAVAAIAATLAPHAAIAAGTRAGTMIDNTATATFDQSGTPVVVDSNTHSIRVDELIDTVVDWTDPGDVITIPGATGQVLTFTVTNNGNGEEAFTLSVDASLAGDDYDPTGTSIVLDSNGNGVYDPGIDTVYTPGALDPVMDPDDTITIFVVANTPGTVADGNRAGVQLVATSNTGTGTPGTSYAGQGEGGGNAVIGNSGGDGDDTGYYQVSAATVALVKSAVIVDPFGGATAVPGSTITYTLTATTTGSGNLPNLVIADTVPTGTDYVPGSITLGGTTLTDAADADAGSFAGGDVSVDLGTVAGGQTRTVTFQVTIGD